MRTKFEVRSFTGPEIIEAPEKIEKSLDPGIPGYAQAPFSPKFLTGFYSDGPCECRPTGKI